MALLPGHQSGDNLQGRWAILGVRAQTLTDEGIDLSRADLRGFKFVELATAGSLVGTDFPEDYPVAVDVHLEGVR